MTFNCSLKTDDWRLESRPYQYPAVFFLRILYPLDKDLGGGPADSVGADVYVRDPAVGVHFCLLLLMDFDHVFESLFPNLFQHRLLEE